MSSLVAILKAIYIRNIYLIRDYLFPDASIIIIGECSIAVLTQVNLSFFKKNYLGENRNRKTKSHRCICLFRRNLFCCSSLKPKVYIKLKRHDF